MSLLNVYLLRHGETTWNADNNRYCGRTDIGLTEKGMQQAAAVKEQLKSITFDGVFSSPLQRAYTTAQIVSGREVTKDDRLIEADFGLWEGKTREEFILENKDSWINWINDPGDAKAGVTGETGKEIVKRVDGFFMELIQHHRTGNVLVVAHNGVNRLYMAYKLGMPMKNYRQLIQLNSAITQFTLDENGHFVLLYLNSKL